jgi:ClpP class serine protease
MRALDAALGTSWAIEPYALEQLLTIAAREHEVTPETLEKYRLEAMDRAEMMERRGSVAVLNVIGPLFRRANLFTEFSGATSYDVLRRDLQVALESRDITSVLLNVDSPGGQANGCGELAKAIFEASKPVVAYVGGTAASGGYWLASAASEIVIDDSAALGSIGVIIGLTDRSAAEKATGVRRWDFVSSQSPLKRGDPDTPEGAGEYQRMADDMADVFLAAVARHRGTTPETVASDFGRGGVLVGTRALEAGMADRIGTFEETLDRLSKREPVTRAAGMKTRPRAGNPSPSASAAADPAAPAATHSQTEDPMADQNPAGPTAADIEAARKDAAAQAIKADRERRTAIMALPEAKGREALADHLHASTEMTVDQVKAALAAAPAAQAQAPVPETKPEGKPETDAAAYEASRLAGAGLGGAPKGPTASAGSARVIERMKAQHGKGVN